jgi:hypothetical protein
MAPRKYTKVRLPTELAVALTYVASTCSIRRQALIESTLAQAAMLLRPETSQFPIVPILAAHPGTPRLAPEVSE